MCTPSAVGAAVSGSLCSERHTDVVGDSSGRSYVIEQGHNVPFLRTRVLEHPSAGRSFLASGPANFFYSSLSVPALFFLLPLLLAQLHFLFCPSIHAPSFSIPTSQMLPVVFAHSVLVSRSLHHITLHSTQTLHYSLPKFFFQGPAENASLSVKGFFCHCYPLLYYTPSIWSCLLVQWIHL